MDNIGQIKAILLECKLITLGDFDKINISFDSKNVYIKGVELRSGDLVEAEKRLELKLVLHNS